MPELSVTLTTNSQTLSDNFQESVQWISRTFSHTEV